MEIRKQQKNLKLKSKNILVFSVDIFGLTLLKQSYLSVIKNVKKDHIKMSKRPNIHFGQDKLIKDHLKT